MRLTSVLIVLIVILIVGCSGGASDPTQPLIPQEPSKAGASDAMHTNFGLWQFSADPDSGTLDVVMLRTGAFHLNALPFLDLPPLTNLTIESLQFNGNIIDADIGLRHPFLGLTEFTGFDVKGTLISNGTVSGFTDTDLTFAGNGDTYLMNPDGLGRWWNPSEFPNDGTIFGYIDGVLGAPDSFANYNSTLNGYKYFCDDLSGTDDPLTLIDPVGRGVFSAGQKNVRHYTIELGPDGLIFNYAVDASWKYPNGSPPFQAPDDFPSDANQPEAYRIEVTQLPVSTLYYDENTLEGGGDLNLSIDVYDWHNAGLNNVKVEWPGFAVQASSAVPSGGGVGYSTYDIDLLACTPGGVGAQALLITIESEVLGYDPVLPDEPVSAYFLFDADVPAGSGAAEPPDISTGWSTETGPYMHWQNGQTIHWIFVQNNLASNSDGDVWLWTRRTSNALSRSMTAFNGDWGTMYEEYLTGSSYWWIFGGTILDVSNTPTFGGELIAGCSPGPGSSGNRLSIAWLENGTWHDKTNQWLIHQVYNSSQEARRINGYRDSTDTFHAFCQINGQLIDYYGDTWNGAWSQTTVAPMPVGQNDYAVQPRTDFVAETSDGYIYLTFVDNGIKVYRAPASTLAWTQVFEVADPDYDSPTIYIDNQDRVFIAARYYVSGGEDQIRLFKSTNGVDFTGPDTLFDEATSRVDPGYLTLKGDADDNLFLGFPHRPNSAGAEFAMMAANPGALEWTPYFTVSDSNMSKHPSFAIRPDGSIVVCYGYSYYGNPNDGMSDNDGSTGSQVYGKDHPGFIN